MMRRLTDWLTDSQALFLRDLSGSTSSRHSNRPVKNDHGPSRSRRPMVSVGRIRVDQLPGVL